jgi:hypothetical protein
MSSRQEPVRIEPDVGIPDLIRRLTDDSKRLASDEVQLAKLELSESIHSVSRGTLWLAVAFGAGVVGAAALTVFLATVLGRLFGMNYWAGAIVTGLLELGVAYLLVMRGLKAFSKPSYTLEATRESLKDTTAWVAAQRAD